MKRSGFKRKQIERAPRGAPVVAAGFRLGARIERAAAAVAKFSYVRSQALLEACRAIPCQHCGREDGTVCAAHSNQGEHGKGKSVKASDVFVASLCFACHGQLDQGREWSQAERVAIWAAAHRRTVALLVQLGLWPAGIEAPA